MKTILLITFGTIAFLCIVGFVGFMVTISEDLDLDEYYWKD